MRSVDWLCELHTLSTSQGRGGKMSLKLKSMQAYQQQLAHYHQSQLQDIPGMYIVQGVPHQDLQVLYQVIS